MAAYAALVSLMNIIQDIQRHHSPPISLDPLQLQSLTQVLTYLQEILEAYNSPIADDDEVDRLEMHITGAAYAAEDVIESYIVDKIRLENQQTSSPANSDEPDLLQILRVFGAESDLLEKLKAVGAEDVTESHIVDKIHLQNQQTSSPANSDEPDISERLRAVGAEDVIEFHIVDKIRLQNQQTCPPADSDEPDLLQMLRAVGAEFDLLEMLRAVGAEDVIESHIVDKIHLQNQRTSFPANSDEPDISERLRAVGAEDVTESHIVDTIHLQNQRTSSPANSDEPDISERLRAGGAESDLLEMLRAVGAEDVIESQIVDKIQLQNQQTSSSVDGDDSDISERLRSVGAEDVIESHIVDKIHLQNQHTSSLASKMSGSFNCFRAPKKPENVDDEQIRSINFCQDLQPVIEEMDSVKLVAMKIDTGKAVVDRDVSASAAPIRSFSSSSAMVYPEPVIVGIMEKLTTGNRRLDLEVIPIVGMGGIGKTTLARTIYARKLIEEHFPVRTWATVSQQYNTREILCEVLSQATNQNKEELTERSEDELGLELHKYLFGRKFLIVLDDMWSIDAWENIKRFFPNNRNDSRILVTTRLLQLSSQLNTNYTHQMEFLNEDSSWDLFSTTVFG